LLGDEGDLSTVVGDGYLELFDLIFEFFDIFGELLIAFGGGVIVINIFI
jgi:hypothetical protein